MSIIKRAFEHEEDKRATALEFAIEQGVLQRCELDETVFERDRTILPDAYRAAASRYARGEFLIFESQREFTDFIQDVVDDHPATDCPACEDRD